MRKNQQGIVLITALFVVAMASTLIAAGLVRSANENTIALIHISSVKSFQLAEAGVDEAILALKDKSKYWSLCGTSTTKNIAITSSYQYSIDCPTSSVRTISTIGTVNSIVKKLEVTLVRTPQNGFYNYAIWGANNVDLTGNSYAVTGDVFTAEQRVSNTQNVSGNVISSPDANPLPGLDYNRLYEIAQSQNNVHLGGNVQSIGFPSSFWYTSPTDPSNSATGVPNVVYIDGDLILNGNIGTIAGFIVVVGNVETADANTMDTTVNGNGIINGAIYTTGTFKINGGGNSLIVTGGVWANAAVVQGSATVQHNADYMKAIEGLGVNANLQLRCWRVK
jgi:hypothetical protein